MDADPPAVQPFVRPGQPRRVIAARVKVLEDTVHELRMQGAGQEQIGPVEQSLAAARREIKDAGGITDGGLRTAIMSEARKLSRREAAVVKAGQTRARLQQNVEDAIAELASHDSAVDQLRAKVEYSRERYAYLVSQQAAEGQLAPRAEAIHRAFAAIREAGEGLGHEVKAHIEVVSHAVALVYGEAQISGKDALAEAWIDSDADVEEHGVDEDVAIDDEPEIRGDMLHNLHMAQDALRAARVQRNKAFLRACRSGTSLPEDDAGALKSKVEVAVRELVEAKEVLGRARRAAAARLEAEAAEDRRRREREEEAEAQRRAAADTIAEQDQARSEAGKRGAAGGEGGSGEDDGDTPCPPRAKWRRAPSESSEATQEEEEIPQVPRGGGDGGDATLQVGTATRGTTARQGDLPGGAARGPGEADGVRRGRGAVRAATLALEARRDEQGGGRWARDSRRAEEGAMEVERASAPRSTVEALADGAVAAAQAATAVAAAVNARGRGRGGEGARSRSPAR